VDSAGWVNWFLKILEIIVERKFDYEQIP